MSLRKILFVSMSILMLAGLAYFGHEAEPSGLKMIQAAQSFLDTLSPELRQKAMFPLNHEERYNWHFIPLEQNRKPTRKGVGLFEMNEAQKQAALHLLRSALSPEGYQTALTIMSLEAILHELEQGKGPTRDPQWYFFTIFGQPSRDTEWGWRVEGHHLSLNFTIARGEVISSTPAFWGANPAVVPSGPKKGQRTIMEHDELARQLLRSLDEQQRKLAYRPTQFPEVQARNHAAQVGAAVGLPAGQMRPEQQELLRQLLDAYLRKLLPQVAEAEKKRLEAAGFERIHFAYAGGTEIGQPRTYRIQGPTFLVEFLNVQPDSAKNPANHIHSVWRSLPTDFPQGARN
ncbi:MAG: DUF3500 domain-containing protein [Gemmatales bacterium]|nr:DUF3500 domain-containing protein [Gemmatales bacterium]MDW7995419.1 DUF3500 domain-containing protein [Gemmatales bacterium]